MCQQWSGEGLALKVIGLHQILCYPILEFSMNLGLLTFNCSSQETGDRKRAQNTELHFGER